MLWMPGGGRGGHLELNEEGEGSLCPSTHSKLSLGSENLTWGNGRTLALKKATLWSEFKVSFSPPAAVTRCSRAQGCSLLPGKARHGGDGPTAASVVEVAMSSVPCTILCPGDIEGSLVKRVGGLGLERRTKWTKGGENVLEWPLETGRTGEETRGSFEEI